MFEEIAEEVEEYRRLLESIKDFPEDDQIFFKNRARQNLEKLESKLVSVPEPSIKISDDATDKEIKQCVKKSSDNVGKQVIFWNPNIRRRITVRQERILHELPLLRDEEAETRANDLIEEYQYATKRGRKKLLSDAPTLVSLTRRLNLSMGTLREDIIGVKTKHKSLMDYGLVGRVRMILPRQGGNKMYYYYMRVL